MFENILKELKIKFNQLKALIISNSLTNEQAQQYFNKLMFASNIVKSSLEKNETAFSAAQLSQIRLFQSDLKDLKKQFSSFFVEDLEHAQMISDFKEHLPERIHTDGLDFANNEILDL